MKLRLKEICRRMLVFLNRLKGKSMLVLSRGGHESIVIGDNIIVKVLEVRGGQVRIGITAPKDISVHREEIYRKIQDKWEDNENKL